MANKNAFLAVSLDDDTLQALERAGRALADAPCRLLGMPDGVGFDFQEALHMTFIFFGEHLRNLPADELRTVHASICERVGAALAQTDAPTAPLRFIGFELFPPDKMNLVVARFAATGALLRLRAELLAACRSQGINFPASLFALIAGEGAWSPHVTLGKIRASKAQVGTASCGGAELKALAPSSLLRPRGLTLLGERPPRAWCDWHSALAFVDDVDDGEHDELPEQIIADNVSNCAGGGHSSGFCAYREAHANLFAWLRAELTSLLDASTADALYESAAAVLMGIDPAEAFECDAEEAAENVAFILSSESQALVPVSEEFQQRFKAVRAGRQDTS